MNRRSWFKSALATVVLAISDGIPKVLADIQKIKSPEFKVKYGTIKLKPGIYLTDFNHYFFSSVNQYYESIQ